MKNDMMPKFHGSKDGSTTCARKKYFFNIQVVSSLARIIIIMVREHSTITLTFKQFNTIKKDY